MFWQCDSYDLEPVRYNLLNCCSLLYVSEKVLLLFVYDRRDQSSYANALLMGTLYFWLQQTFRVVTRSIVQVNFLGTALHMVLHLSRRGLLILIVNTLILVRADRRCKIHGILVQQQFN